MKFNHQPPAEFEPDAAIDRAVPAAIAAYQEYLVQVHSGSRGYGRGVDLHKTGNDKELRVTNITIKTCTILYYTTDISFCLVHLYVFARQK